MAKRRVTNPLALAVLSCLCQRPMHPYEMASTMRLQHQESAVKLNYGSLYSVVDVLGRAGFVRPLETTRKGRRPERTTYEVTDAGRAEMTDWLRELIGVPAKEFTRFGAGLTFMMALPPDEALEQLAVRVDLLEDQVRVARAALAATAEGSATRPGVARIHLVEDDYELAMKEAELDWVRKLIQGISDRSIDGVDYWREHHAGGQDGSP